MARVARRLRWSLWAGRGQAEASRSVLPGSRPERQENLDTAMRLKVAHVIMFLYECGYAPTAFQRQRIHEIITGESAVPPPPPPPYAPTTFRDFREGRTGQHGR